MLKTALNIIEARIAAEPAATDLVDVYPTVDGSFVLDLVQVEQLPSTKLFGSSVRVSVAGVGAIGYILKLTSHNNLVLVAHVSRSTKRGLIAFRIRPLLKRDSKDWLNKNVSIRATLPREVDRKDLIALYNKAVARFSKRNDVVTARIASEQRNETVSFFPINEDDTVSVTDLRLLLAQLFSRPMKTKLIDWNWNYYFFNVSVKGKPRLAFEIWRRGSNNVELSIYPIAYRTYDCPLGTSSSRVLMKLHNHKISKRLPFEVSSKTIMDLCEKAFIRFKNIDDDIVTARAAGEVQVITNLRQQLPRSFDIGKLVFRLDSSGVDPNEYRSWMRYVATLDEEKQWRLRVYVYMDEPGQGHSIIHDEVYPLSYYVQLDVANRRTDVVEERVKHCSASNLIKQIAEDVKKTTKHCAEIIVDEKMADKKSASEYTKLFKAAFQ